MPIGVTLLFSLNCMHGGVRLLRREDWIVERNARNGVTIEVERVAPNRCRLHPAVPAG